MPFLPFVVLLAWQAVSKSASFALGWATALYFGQIPGKQGRVVAVMGLASTAWVIVVAGFAVPLLVGALLDALAVISRNFTVEPLHALGLAAGIVVTPPALAAATIWAEFHGEPSPRGFLRLVPVSYPATASMGLGVAQMIVFTPFLAVQRLVRKHTLLQTALSLREEAGDDELTSVVARALHGIGIERVEVEEARGFLTWPMRTVAFATKHLLRAVVRGEPMTLRANGLRIFAYATNVAILGPSADAHRARAALERELPFCNARITWSETARALEDELMRVRGMADGDPSRVHAELEKVQQRIDAENLDAEEWNVLYRIRLQIEQASLREAALSERRSGSRSRPPSRRPRTRSAGAPPS